MDNKNKIIYLIKEVISKLRPLALLILIYLTFPGLVLAQNNLDLVSINAKSISLDTNTGIVTAKDKVEINSGLYTILANHVIYNPEDDKVIAYGDIIILEPNGDVIFADEIELTDQLKNGFISGIRVLLSDKSRLAGSHAIRKDGNKTELINAIFTSCNSCAGDTNPPIWQIKASRVIHNHQAKRIDYKDARLEFFGIPILYTPFFSHPDPSVVRQSGLLAPSYSTSSHLGFQIEVPYYFNLAPHRDVIIAPIFTSREGIVLTGNYRERTSNGNFTLEQSITYPKKRVGSIRTGGNDLRGHARATGKFTINPLWRWGFEASRSTDDTYLRRYGFSNEKTLVTNTYLEGF